MLEGKKEENFYIEMMLGSTQILGESEEFINFKDNSIKLAKEILVLIKLAKQFYKIVKLKT